MINIRLSATCTVAVTRSIDMFCIMPLITLTHFGGGRRDWCSDRVVGWTIRGLICGWIKRDFTPPKYQKYPQNIRICGPHSVIFKMAAVFLPGGGGGGGGKRQLGRKFIHSPLRSAKVKNEWSYTSTALTYHHGVGGDKMSLFTISFILILRTVHLLSFCTMAN